MPSLYQWHGVTLLLLILFIYTMPESHLYTLPVRNKVSLIVNYTGLRVLVAVTD